MSYNNNDDEYNAYMEMSEIANTASCQEFIDRCLQLNGHCEATPQSWSFCTFPSYSSVVSNVCFIQQNDCTYADRCYTGGWCE